MDLRAFKVTEMEMTVSLFEDFIVLTVKYLDDLTNHL